MIRLIKRSSIKRIKQRYQDRYLGPDKNSQVKLQIELFNKIWESAQLHPFYQDLKIKYNLPSLIDDISELANFPELTKSMIQTNKEIVCKGHNSFVSTGGSTGEPTVFPTSSHQKSSEFDTTYTGRYLSGLEVGHKTLIIWGHSHLYGKGWSKYKSILIEKVKDALNSRKRLNAYDLNANNIDKFYKGLVSFRPRILIGYTSSIHLLANYIKQNDLQPNVAFLEAVVVTAENITAHEEETINSVFNNKLIKEYGMAETSTIAYSTLSSRNYTTMYDAQLVVKNEKDELIVTCLYERDFPLINYNTEDKIVCKCAPYESVFEFEKIIGRVIEIFSLTCLDETSIDVSGIMIIHMLKNLKDVLLIVPTQSENILRVSLYATEDSLQKLDIDEAKNGLIEKIEKEFGKKLESKNIVFSKASNIERNISGKMKNG